MSKSRTRGGSRSVEVSTDPLDPSQPLRVPNVLPSTRKQGKRETPKVKRQNVESQEDGFFFFSEKVLS